MCGINKEENGDNSVRVVDESVEERNEKILQELRNWFREDVVSIPWVNEIKDIIVKEE